MSKQLLLVGAGYSHLEVLFQLKHEPLYDVNVCMVTPSLYQYHSGMFAGYTEGLYSIEEIRIDIQKLMKEADVHFIRKKASKVIPEQKKLVCDDGSVYPFDVISFDIGSLSLPPDFDNTVARKIKSNDELVDQLAELRKTTHPLIVGGNAMGSELAFSIQAYKKKHHIPGQVRVIAAEQILSEASKRISGKLRSLLIKKGIQVWEEERVSEVYDYYIQTNQGNKVCHTGLVWLGGAIADPLFERSELEVDDRGFPLTRSTLQFKKYDYIFGAGDCVTLLEYPRLRRNWRYGVKQGPVLWNNLKQFITKQSLTSYTPQKNSHYILSTGRKKGFLVYGPIAHHSHRAWKVKNKTNQEFVERYKNSLGD